MQENKGVKCNNNFPASRRIIPLEKTLSVSWNALLLGFPASLPFKNGNGDAACVRGGLFVEGCSSRPKRWRDQWKWQDDTFLFFYDLLGFFALSFSLAFAIPYKCSVLAAKKFVLLSRYERGRSTSFFLSATIWHIAASGCSLFILPIRRLTFFRHPHLTTVTLVTTNWARFPNGLLNTHRIYFLYFESIAIIISWVYLSHKRALVRSFFSSDRKVSETMDFILIIHFVSLHYL